MYTYLTGLDYTDFNALLNEIVIVEDTLDTFLLSTLTTIADNDDNSADFLDYAETFLPTFIDEVELDYLEANTTTNTYLNPAQVGDDDTGYIIFEYANDHQYVVPSADDADAIDLFLSTYADGNSISANNTTYAIFTPYDATKSYVVPSADNLNQYYQ